MAHYLERAWHEVGKKINFYVPGRTSFFLYSDHNKFEQTNIVPIDEGTGGVTEAFKNRFLIFNDGSQTWLQHVIPHEFTHVTQFNVLYAGWWKSVRLLKSPFYPLWFMEGMAEYGGGEIDAPNGEMVVRDAVYTKTLIGLPELQGFAHLKPNQVTLGYKTGEMAMHFLEDEFGQEKVGQFLNIMVDHFDVSSALESLLGTDLYRFDFRFQEWLGEQYADLFARAHIPSYYGPQQTKNDLLPQSNEGPAISQDGKKIYFFSDRNGPVRIYEKNLETGKIKLLLDLKYSSFEYLHPEGRALSVSPDGNTLAFSSEKKQKDFLYLFDLKKKKLKKIKTEFDQIRSPYFSPTDDTMVVVGLTQGYNDLYLMKTDGSVVKRLTNNPQDERDPVFTPDGKKIIYSGEMMTPDMNPNGRDLFSLDIESLEITPLTNLPGEEREPEPLPDGSIVFVRDRNEKDGFGFNLYRMKSPGQKPEQMTDMIGGAFSPRYSVSTDSLYYIGFHAGEKHIYQYTASSFTARSPETAAGPLDEQEAALNPKAKAMTQALHTWPEGVVSPLIQGVVRPYKFEGSTDLFLPFFFYSSLDGFVFADIWQYSDLLGNHRIQQQMQYASQGDLHDIGLFYTYAKFRPDFTLGVRSIKYFMDAEEIEQRHDVSSIALMSYPLDRIHSFQVGAGITDQKTTYLDDSEPIERKYDRFWITSLIRDTVTGRYLIPTQGNRYVLYYQEGVDTGNGNQFYRSGGLNAAQYFMLPMESTLATRLFYGRSTGRDAQVYRLGGQDRIRGVSQESEANKKHNAIITGAEMRFRLAYLNARTKFLYPDFFFKAAYLIVFDDFGYGWDSAAERDAFTLGAAQNSAGVGISWPTFIIQSFKLDFTILWAKRTDISSETWYITLGPSF